MWMDHTDPNVYRRKKRKKTNEDGGAVSASLLHARSARFVDTTLPVMLPRP